MTRADAIAVLTRALGEIAPDADVHGINPDGLLQDEIGLDSIDFLNVVNAVGDEAGFHISERDFASLVTFEGFVAYLVARRDDGRRA